MVDFPVDLRNYVVTNNGDGTWSVSGDIHRSDNGQFLAHRDFTFTLAQFMNRLSPERRDRIIRDVIDEVVMEEIRAL